jgi:hypothetical protein
MLMG